MKGIILAGGSGTRLYPMTVAVSKQLLPVYDKPMVYYPLSVLMLAGLKEILLISTPHDLPLFKKLLGSGEQWGIDISYAVQPKPEGLVQAFLIAETFLDGEEACLILGDNIFYGQGLPQILQNSVRSMEKEGAIVFGYRVHNPQQYGVIEFDCNQKVVTIQEKPLQPRSNYAVTGLYFYDKNVCDYSREIIPSARGELEITALNNVYLSKNQLKCSILGRGMVWFDTGTPESLTEASSYFLTIEKRQGLKASCLEEIAVYMGYMTKKQIMECLTSINNKYLEYVCSLMDGTD